MHSTKNESRISLNSQNVLNSLKYWVLAARPKTWIASISPVLIANSMAAPVAFNIWIFICTLCFSLCIQIGTNFANDYFDFIKGADTQERQGPKRAVAEGWIPLRSMKKGIIFTFALSLAMAFPLIKITGTWGLALALIAIACGILYTAGPKPLGYIGLGELFVFMFFGPIATIGSYYVQTLSWNMNLILLSLPPGLLSSAILVANNLRDETTDRKAKKNTLIVRFGTLFGKWEYSILILSASLIPILMNRAFFCGIFSLLYASYLTFQCISSQTAQKFIPLLPKTSLLLTLYTLLFYIFYA